MADNQDILNPINDSDHVNFHYVYDIYRKLGFIFEPSMTANMARLWTGDLYEERIWETMKPKELFRGESSGLMAYKAEDIYFTLLTVCMGAHMVMLLQVDLHYNYKGMTYFPIVVVTAMSTNQSDFS